MLVLLLQLSWPGMWVLAATPQQRARGMGLPVPGSKSSMRQDSRLGCQLRHPCRLSRSSKGYPCPGIPLFIRLAQPSMLGSRSWQVVRRTHLLCQDCFCMPVAEPKSLPAGRRPGSGQVPADQVHRPPIAAGSVHHWQGLLRCRPDGCCAEGADMKPQQGSWSVHA